MKKLCFTLQVFSHLAMLPMIVILEMNHAKRGFTNSKDRANMTGRKSLPSIFGSIDKMAVIDNMSLNDPLRALPFQASY